MNPRIERSHAVLVGIEQYEFGADRKADSNGAGNPDGNLRGPALDACRLAAMLRAQGMPEDHLTVLVRPVPEHTAAVNAYGLPVRTVNGDDLHRFLDQELRQRSGDLLLVYWAGHGFEYQGRQWVCYPEASRQAWHSQDFEGTLLSILRSTEYRFPRQQFFLDACRVDAADLLIPGAPLARPFVPTTPVARYQEALLAAARGAEATNLPEERTGWFSRELCQAATEVFGWPWDHGKLYASICARAESPTGLPIRLVRKSIDGSVQDITFGRSELRRAGELVESTDLAGAADKPGELGRLLSRVSRLREEQYRRTLVRLLDRRFPHSFPDIGRGSYSGYDICERLSEMESGFETLGQISRTRRDLFPPAEAAVVTLQGALGFAARHDPAGPGLADLADTIGARLDEVPAMRAPGQPRRLTDWIGARFPGLGAADPHSGWDVSDWLAGSTHGFTPLGKAMEIREDWFPPANAAVTALRVALRDVRVDDCHDA